MPSSADQASIVMTAGDAELRDALRVANLPTLLLVLAQLSGDPRWLADPYRPSRTIALNDNDDGGFSDAIQAEIRSAAFSIIKCWRDGKTPLPAPPADDQVIGMITTSLGEEVPPEYAVTMAEEAGSIRGAR